MLTVPQAGGLVIQRGFGLAAPTFQLSTPNDGFLGNVATAVDASSGALVASWYSSATPGGLWYQRVAPTTGAASKLPGPVSVGERQEQVIAARDSGAGVYGAYAADTGAHHIRLARYGGGSVAVGQVKQLRAATIGVATGPSGRIWVMWWGQIGGKGVLAVTRSNRAVTRFEPIQRFRLNSEYMWRLGGDGRLGPLDLLVNEVPVPASGKPLGIYYARVLPMLSVHVAVHPHKNKAGHVLHYKLVVKVTDAGDPVSGATVSVLGHKAKTAKGGTATLKLPGSAPAHPILRVAKPGYRRSARRLGL